MNAIFRVTGVLCMALFLAAAGTSDSPLVDAAKAGDQETARALLEEGIVDVNEAEGDGMTALHYAAMNGDGDLAELLVSAGADVSAVTRLGSYTPLHLASRRGNADAVRVLLEAGADAHATTDTGEATTLHLAAASGSSEAVRLLLEAGVEPDARESRWGQTPLIFAASANRAEAIRTLLDGGADPSVTTKAVNIPQLAEFHSEAHDEFDRVLEEFEEEYREEHGEDATFSPTQEQLRAASDAVREYLRTMEPLEAEEPEPGTTSQNQLVGSWGGLTALLHAVRQGHKESTLALLEGGADINQVSGGDSTSPLLMAAINGQFDLAITLLEHGADPMLASEAGATPLYAAIERQWTPRSRFPQVREHRYQEASHLDLMEALLEAGADPNVRLDKHLWYMAHVSCGNFNCGLEVVWGATPFWRAAYGLDVDAMQLLIAYGADPNIPTRKPPERGNPYGDDDEEEEQDPSGLPAIEEGGPGVYPIHAVSGVGYGTGFGGNAHQYHPSGFLPALKFLVEEVGVDVNARDHNGYTALHHAASRGDNEVIHYLVENGADVTVVSRAGQTTADMANGPVQRVSPYPATVELLESLGSHNNDNCLAC